MSSIYQLDNLRAVVCNTDRDFQILDDCQVCQDWNPLQPDQCIIDNELQVVANAVRAGIESSTTTIQPQGQAYVYMQLKENALTQINELSANFNENLGAISENEIQNWGNEIPDALEENIIELFSTVFVKLFGLQEYASANSIRLEENLTENFLKRAYCIVFEAVSNNSTNSNEPKMPFTEALATTTALVNYGLNYATNHLTKGEIPFHGNQTISVSEENPRSVNNWPENYIVSDDLTEELRLIYNDGNEAENQVALELEF